MFFQRLMNCYSFVQGLTYIQGHAAIINPFCIMLKYGQHTIKSCIVYTARLLKYVWPFFNMHESVTSVTSKTLLVVNDTAFFIFIYLHVRAVSFYRLK